MLNELNELKRKKKEIKAAFREGRHASQASYRLAETEVEYNSWAAEVALLEAQIKHPENRALLKRLQKKANRASAAYTNFRNEELRSIRENGWESEHTLKG